MLATDHCFILLAANKVHNQELNQFNNKFIQSIEFDEEQLKLLWEIYYKYIDLFIS